jgi:hypothetical protein
MNTPTYYRRAKRRKEKAPVLTARSSVTLIRGTNSSESNGPQTSKRYASPEARQRMSRAAKARWARERAERKANPHVWRPPRQLKGKLIRSLVTLALIKRALKGKPASKKELAAFVSDAVNTVAALRLNEGAARSFRVGVSAEGSGDSKSQGMRGTEKRDFSGSRLYAR